MDGAREDNLIRLLNAVSTRVAYLSATDLLDGVALDKYTFTRDAYLQRRQSLIEDSRPPSDEEDEVPQPRYDLPETEEEAAAAAAAASSASAPDTVALADRRPALAPNQMIRSSCLPVGALKDRGQIAERTPCVAFPYVCCSW